MTTVRCWKHSLAACAATGLLMLGAASAADETAVQWMATAHEGRAVWRDFPGFSADLVATADGQQAKGTLDVAADGSLTLKLGEASGMEWVERTLESVVGHRLSDDGAITQVAFADDETNHPLGRLLKSTKADDKSLWRVQGDLMTEVHRNNGKTRFIISVTEVARTAEGKHLPRSFVVTTWNNETNAIQTARQVYNEWQRFGHVDLPTRMLGITAKADGSRRVEEIVLSNQQLKPPKTGTVSITELPPLKAGVTSFGAAISGGYLYTYGGHLGTPHKYSAEDQSNQLLRLNLANPAAWETVAEGPRRTGLAMVAYAGKLYRVGGWESKNSGGEKWDLHSSNDFARFDPKSGKWQDLAPLPEGRSSHDAALLGSKLYVIGGWKLAGEGEGEWHDTACVCDLAEANPQWQAIAKPTFIRRALAVATFADKVYAIGGMDDSNETVTAVAVFDPQSNAWSEGPAIPGKGFDGFGASAFATREGLFVTTGSGGLYRLAENGKQWEAVGELSHPRMFHRMLATEEGRLVVVGGTSRKSGKVSEVESIQVKLATAGK